MTALLLAFSLSNKLLEVGALAAFAALLGIAVLSLLVFSQAREIKRLREWAGRAPERAAELEQRVSSEAAARAQRIVQPVPRPVGTVTPRTAPVVARAPTVERAEPAVQATSGVAVAAVGEVAAGQPAAAVSGQAAPGAPGQVAPAAPGQPVPAAAPTSPGQPGTPNRPAVSPVPGQPAFVASAQPATGEQSAGAPEKAGAPEAPGPPATASSSDTQGAAAVADVESAKVAPATVAAAAAAMAPSATATRSLEPTPRAPAPPSPARPAVGTAGAAGSGPATPPPPPRPALPPRPQAPPRPAAALRTPVPQFLVEEERSPRRATAMIVGGVGLGLVVLAVVLLSLGGGSTGNHSSTASGHAARSGSSGRHTHTGGGGSAKVASPAETHVVVLNATEANGLAHKLSGNLQQSGYTLSAALSGRPPSGRSTSVVEYANGHREEALHVGQTLGISQLAPLEGAIAPLVGSATVVVIAGADQAALAGLSSGSSASGSPAQSGEAPAGGEAAAGTGQ